MKSNLRNEIKSYIVRQGMTMQEVVDLLADEYGWSDSASNLSNKLKRESLRYTEAVQLAEVLGFEIVWRKRGGAIMAAPQYAILRFAKYKGPEISGIESHNERTKEKYASNPDIDPTRTHLNFHLIKPKRKYRAEAEKQIAEAGCRTRSDSVRVVEALITATPEFFKGRKRAEIKEFFSEALEFMKQHQSPETIISAVVHMDEKTPHMHLCFVPLTKDKRLCAKEILGNKKKLTQWQDRYWEHMVKKYPDLERGESASQTGRTHIPPRLFKEAVHLNRMKDQIMAILNDSNPFNKKAKAEELEALLDKYIPGVEAMRTKLKKFDKSYKELTEENAELEKKLSTASKESVRKKLEISQKLNELDELRRMVEVLPPEVLKAAKKVIAHKPQER